MIDRTSTEPVDVKLLDEAAKKLLGYYVYRKFRTYLGSITAALHQQYQDGLSKGLTRPTPRGRATLFDFRALDYNALIELVGVYMYVLACHKSANWRLLQRDEAKHVLYLRGYDFEAAFSIGGGMAAGLPTMETEGFTLKLPGLMKRRLFKVLSPKEVDWETMTSERYYEDFDAMIKWINKRPAAVYLNAWHWKQRVMELIPRMDHYLVYISSLTESALWELDQLHTDQRRSRVTVVFDEDAIGKKASHLAIQKALTGRLGEAIWAKQGGPPSLTVAQVREDLTEVFTVMDPVEFEAHIDEVRHRIDGSDAELRPGKRETWLDFEFYPAVQANDLRRLREMSQMLAELVEAGQTGPIDCLPLYVAQLQLRIYLTLLFGDHAAAGRALAAYSAVMQSASDHYTPPGERAGALSEENRPQLLAILANHSGFAEYAGRRLLAYGRSHEFIDQSGQAKATWEAIFDVTRTSVDKVFMSC
jgi:hypothetical protein